MSLFISKGICIIPKKEWSPVSTQSPAIEKMFVILSVTYNLAGTESFNILCVKNRPVPEGA